MPSYNINRDLVSQVDSLRKEFDRLKRSLSFDTLTGITILSANGDVLVQGGDNGNGMGFPKIPLNFVPLATTFTVPNTATLFTDFMQGRLTYQNQSIVTTLQVTASDGSTAGSFRYRDNTFGTMTGVTNYVAGSGTIDLDVTSSYLFPDYGTDRDIFLQGRITAGTGSLTVRYIRAVGD